VRALFDVNVLLALFDDNHIHHREAAKWWDEHRDEGWATCPTTQNGFLRVISKPSYRYPIRLADALQLLQRQTELPAHKLWSESLSLLDVNVFNHGYILGPNQITDVYLLALAVANEGRLVSFDRGIPLSAVHRATQRHLVVL
jgi:toxin-antitoxin system PIN domain toxin